MIRARKRFGQHFLEPAWARKVLDAARPQPSDRFLEIGPGGGALTFALAPRVARLTVVEIDRDLAADLARRAPRNVRVVTQDFVEFDLGSFLDTESDAAPRVIGNLPYNVSSPILSRLLQYADRLVDATLMVQREVADRLLAGPGTSEYGVLTILTRIHAEASRLLDLPPGAFRPAPKVHSSVVRLRFHPCLVPRSVLPAFERLVRASFQHRRKTILNALRTAVPDLDVAEVAAALRASGIDAVRRPETLQVSELTRLAERFPF